MQNNAMFLCFTYVLRLWVLDGVRREFGGGRWDCAQRVPHRGFPTLRILASSEIENPETGGTYHENPPKSAPNNEIHRLSKGSRNLKD